MTLASIQNRVDNNARICFNMPIVSMYFALAYRGEGWRYTWTVPDTPFQSG